MMNETTRTSTPDEAKRAVTRRRLVSIRLVVTAAAVTITAAAVLAVGMVGERQSRNALTAEIESRLMLSARNLALSASSPLLDEFPELTLHPMIKEMQAAQPDLAFVVVIDHEGKIQGHADSREIGGTYVRPEGFAARSTRVELGSGEELSASENTIVAVAPILHPSGRVLGRAELGLKSAYIEAIIGSTRRVQLIILVVTLVLGVGAAFFLINYLMRPIPVLRAGLERIGRGDLDTPLPVQDHTELGLLAEAVNRMTGDLRLAQQQLVEKERLAHEVALAREIQTSLLPEDVTRIKSFVVAGSQHAATEVGGDYYDILELADGKVGVAIADVSGKGLAGCLVMSMVSALLHAFKDTFQSPAALLGRLDAELGGSLRRGSFVTMFYGILDPDSGHFVCASAGHNPTLIYRRTEGKVEEIASRGVPLGAIRGGAAARTYKDASMTLGAGDVVLQYTDGINEAFNRSREQFGLERIAGILAEKASEGAATILEQQRLAVDLWTDGDHSHDDETLLVISRENVVALERAAPDRATGINPADSLEEALERGCHLELAASLEAMGAVPAWIAGLETFAGWTEAEMNVISTAVYESCANIAEHGYRLDGRKSMDLWWVSGSASPKSGRNDGNEGPGYFLIRDHGRPFSADNWKESDFRDPAVWRRGRGFGLDIIHRAMLSVDYRTTTDNGNLTVLVVEGRKHDQTRISRHA